MTARSVCAAAAVMLVGIVGSTVSGASEAARLLEAVSKIEKITIDKQRYARSGGSVLTVTDGRGRKFVFSPNPRISPTERGDGWVRSHSVSVSWMGSQAKGAQLPAAEGRRLAEFLRRPSIPLWSGHATIGDAGRTRRPLKR